MGKHERISDRGIVCRLFKVVWLLIKCSQPIVPSPTIKLPPDDLKKEPQKGEDSSVTTPIPIDGLLDGGFMGGLSFSTRGSILVDGKKGVNGHIRQNVGRRYSSQYIAKTSDG